MKYKNVLFSNFFFRKASGQNGTLKEAKTS